MDAVLNFLKNVDYVANIGSPFSNTGKPTVTLIDQNTKIIKNVTVSLSEVSVEFIAGGFIISAETYNLSDSLVFLHSKVYSLDSIYVVDGNHYVSADLMVRKK